MRNHADIYETTLLELKDHLKLERAMSANTIAAYTSDVRKYFALLRRDGTAPADASSEDISRFIEEQVAAGVTKRSQARIRGQLRNYHIEETRTFKADTGILNTAMADWADELFRSDEVYVVNVINGAISDPDGGKEVVITESKSERRNDDDFLPRFTFSYQYSQRTQNVMQMNRVGRIFDNTFDHTFN